MNPFMPFMEPYTIKNLIKRWQRFGSLVVAVLVMTLVGSMQGHSRPPMQPLVALHFSPHFVDWVNNELSGARVELEDTTISVPFCNEGRSLVVENADLTVDLGSVVIHPPTKDKKFHASLMLNQLHFAGDPTEHSEATLGKFCNDLANALDNKDQRIDLAGAPLEIEGEIHEGEMSVQNANIALSSLPKKAEPLAFFLQMVQLLNSGDTKEQFSEKIAEMLSAKKIFPIAVPLYFKKESTQASDTLEIAYTNNFHGEITESGGATLIAEGRLREQLFKPVDIVPCPKPARLQVGSLNEVTAGTNARPDFTDGDNPPLIMAAINGTTINNAFARYTQDGRLCLSDYTPMANMLTAVNPGIDPRTRLAIAAYPSRAPTVQLMASADGTPEIALGSTALTVEFGMMLEDHFITMSRLESDLNLHGRIEMTDDHIGFSLLPKDAGGTNDLNVRLADVQTSNVNLLGGKLDVVNKLLNYGVAPMLTGKHFKMLPRRVNFGPLKFSVDDVRIDDGFLMVGANFSGLKEFLIEYGKTKRLPDTGDAPL